MVSRPILVTVETHFEGVYLTHFDRCNRPHFEGAWVETHPFWAVVETHFGGVETHFVGLCAAES